MHKFVDIWMLIRLRLRTGCGGFRRAPKIDIRCLFFEARSAHDVCCCPRRVRRMTGDMGDLKSLLAQVAEGRSLSESQAEAAFEIIMSGNATPSQMGGFL